MGIFGFFKSAPFADPVLGTLRRSGGRWKGTVSFGPHTDVALRVIGDKTPDPVALTLARDLPARFEELRGPIETALFEHHEPYRESGVADALPRFAHAADVWPHVTPVFVSVEPLAGSPTRGPILEIAYRVAWDEEHTVAARVQDWRVFELCGSV